jgi:hypothetical protein
MMIPESYGAVSFPTTSNLRRRRPHQPDNQDVKESRYAANGVFLKSQNKNSRSREEESRPVVYKYNSTIAKLLIPSLSVTYLCHHSPIPFIVTLYAVLFLYGVDLSGSKEGITVGIWIAYGTIFISVVIEYYSTGQEHAWGFLGLIADGLNLFCLVRLLLMYCECYYYVTSKGICISHLECSGMLGDVANGMDLQRRLVVCQVN